MKIATKHTSNSLVTFVRHKRYSTFCRPLLSAILLRKLSVAECRGSGVVGRGRGLWVPVNVVDKKKNSEKNKNLKFK